jgi:hypothetical protein
MLVSMVEWRVGEEHLYTLLVGMQIIAASMETNVEFLQKLKVELVILILGLYQKAPKKQKTKSA